MVFQPALCPRSNCPSRLDSSFSYCRRGWFRRRCDGLVVPRFRCHACQRGFSEQSFRVNYRLKRPDLLAWFFKDRVSSVSHRMSARNHGCSRSTEERHFRRISSHCKAFHRLRLSEIVARGGLGEDFSLDELETFEQDRRRKPLTVPILIERNSWFVVDTQVGTLPARRRRGQGRRRRARPPSDLQNERKSESRQVVGTAFERLREMCPKDRPLVIHTDRKPLYCPIVRALFGERCQHVRTSGKAPRNDSSKLFPINHTLAMARYNLSRLLRRNWCNAKLRRWLAGQLAIWVCARNYVRDATNKHHHITAAMALGAHERPWEVAELLEWAVFPRG